MFRILDSDCAKKSGTNTYCRCVIFTQRPILSPSTRFCFGRVALCILFYIAGKNAFVIYVTASASSKSKQIKLGCAAKKSLAKMKFRERYCDCARE